MKLDSETDFILTIAQMLITEGRAKSLRDFSLRYLNKNPNILCVIKYKNIKPSLSILLALYLRLNQEHIYPNIQQQLSKLIYQRAFASYN